MRILEQRNGMLFCCACNKNIRFRKKVDVRQHFVGARKKGNDGTEAKKLFYVENVASMHKRLERRSLVDWAVEQNTKNVFAQIVGHTLSGDIRTDRATVPEDFYVLGIPTAKLSNKRLIHLIEQPHTDLGGRTQCFQL